MALFQRRRAVHEVAATTGPRAVVAQVPGQVAAAPRAAAAEEAQKSASFMGEELSENYDKVAATALDGQEESPTVVEDEGAGPPAAGV